MTLRISSEQMFDILQKAFTILLKRFKVWPIIYRSSYCIRYCVKFGRFIVAIEFDLYQPLHDLRYCPIRIPPEWLNIELRVRPQGHIYIALVLPTEVASLTKAGYEIKTDKIITYLLCSSIQLAFLQYICRRIHIITSRVDEKLYRISTIRSIIDNYWHCHFF